MPTGRHALAIAALVSWLITESLGAYMLRTWFSSGAARLRHAQPDGLPLPVLFGHAGLALAGLLCWLTFLLTSASLAALLAAALLAPAIGLGISTVTVWTPYPVHRPPVTSSPPDGVDIHGQHGVLSDDLLERVLADEALASRLVDDLLDRNIAVGPPPARRGRSDLRPLIPLAHGVLAMITFLLATLAAVAAL